MTPLAKGLAALLALAAGGCAGVPAAPSGTAASNVPGGSSGSAAASADAARIAAARRGERVTLGENTLPGRSSVVVGERYDAASGRVCHRLHADDGSPLARIVCGGNGSWRFVRSLEPRAGRRAPLPVVVAPIADRPAAARPIATALAVFPVTSDSVDLAMHDLVAGETLWHFAERITGDGSNWQEIARLNDIEDPTRFEGERALAVPDVLVRD